MCREPVHGLVIFERPYPDGPVGPSSYEIVASDLQLADERGVALENGPA